MKLISLDDAIEIIAETDITDGTEPVFSGKQVIGLLKDLPTVCDIGQIRTEIKSLKIHGTDDVSITNNFAIDKVLQIINRHMKGDSE